jgi:hypothetical protein
MSSAKVTMISSGRLVCDFWLSLDFARDGEPVEPFRDRFAILFLRYK